MTWSEEKAQIFVLHSNKIAFMPGKRKFTKNEESSLGLDPTLCKVLCHWIQCWRHHRTKTICILLKVRSEIRSAQIWHRPKLFFFFFYVSLFVQLIQQKEPENTWNRVCLLDMQGSRQHHTNASVSVTKSAIQELLQLWLQTGQ